MPSTRLYRTLARLSAVLAFGLIVLGGVVRITGSGMGCGEHWPRCNGQWFPPLDLPTLIEIGHRWSAALVSVFVLALAVVAWRRHRAEPRLRTPATLALVLLVVQVLLGAVTVKLALPPGVIIVHLGNAMLLLGTLLIAALRAGAVGGIDGLTDGTAALKSSSVYPTIRLAVVFGLAVVLLGALVANYHAGLLCTGFPLCNGSLLPAPTPLGFLPWVHRVAAFGFAGYMVWLVVTLRGKDRAVYRAAHIALGLTLLQVGVAAAMVLELLPPGLRALHLTMGTAVWASLVYLWWTARECAPSPYSSPIPGEGNGVRGPSLLSDFVTLTKPRIISLLLVTTVAPMFITGRGAPGVGLLLWVIVGGYLMAGGANAINMWFDRDIDILMSRTKLRPVPSGRLTPGAALVFGIGLGVTAFILFWYFVNPLSAGLALAGLVFYVFVYTLWLKRASPQNIVIGGAAGAFPPLVGWAAMTNSLDWGALYLFAIIFYWTPPHFWALALIKEKEYARAGVPMLPVVRGAHHTKVQMLVYTLLLLPLTILPTLSGHQGLLYAGAALLLGARLLWYCLKLLKETGPSPLPWRMYKYSLLYLALLFVAMGIDRYLPVGHITEQPPEVVILGK